MRRPIAVCLAAAIAISGAATTITPASAASTARISPAVSESLSTANALVEEVGWRGKRRYRGVYGQPNKRVYWKRPYHYSYNRPYYGKRYYRHHRPYYGKRYYRRDNNVGAAFAAGIIGLTLGAIIAQSGRSESNWYAYCSSKYRSFNPRTGKYLGYDGHWHYCR